MNSKVSGSTIQAMARVKLSHWVFLKFHFKLASLLLIFCIDTGALAFEVDPNDDVHAKEALLSFPGVDVQIIEVRKTVIEGETFSDFEFVSRPSKPPVENTNEYKGEHFLMFLGSKYSWICHIRVDGLWRKSTEGQITLVTELSRISPSPECYPII